MADSSCAPSIAADWVCPVIKISIPWMLEVIAALDRIDLITPETEINHAYFDLVAAEVQLETLFGQSVYSPYLRTSRAKGDELYRAIQQTTRMKDDDPAWNHPMTWRIASIRTKRDQFKLVFLSEISTLPVFLVNPKENYDVTLLIEHGAGLFPSAMLAKAPEAAFDAGEVGKALAFSLPTACGFHTFRVVESVLRRYWDAVTSDPRPEPQTLGKMAADLDNKKAGDTKTLEALKQFAKLHRNPCVHPDVVLTEEEAIGTLGIARSCIAGMLSILPDAPPPTTVASSPATPGP